VSSRGGEALPTTGDVATVQTRVFRGRTIDDVIPQIQQEMGADAIIVRRREGLSGGILGFFQHPWVEIEAMPGGPSIDLFDEDLGDSPLDLLDAPPPPPVQTPLERPRPSPQAAAPAPPAPPAPTAGTYRPPPARPAPEQPPEQPPFYRRIPGDPGMPSAYLTAHLAALARSRPRPAPPALSMRPPVAPIDFDELLPRTTRPPARRLAPPPLRPPVQSAPERRTVPPGSHSRARAGVEAALRRVGVSEEMSAELIDGALAHAVPLAPRAGLASAVRSTLAQRIPVAPPLPAQGAAIVVIGAGGAGKTACCAALLGAYRTSSTLPASCASLLRDPTGEELHMILTPQVVKPVPAAGARGLRALRKARKAGLALVDTPSLSPADKSHIRELAALIAELKPERVLVALPATLGATAAAQLLGALRPLGANSVAVTHADETDQLGVAVEAACRFGLAPEYMLERGKSGGWRVSRIDPSELAERLLT